MRLILIAALALIAGSGLAPAPAPAQTAAKAKPKAAAAKPAPKPVQKPAARPAPKMVKIAIYNFKFAPETIVVKPGTTVTWTNMDEAPHTVVALDKKSFRSPALDTDDSWSFTFTTPGEFAYFCSLHPFMRGKVIVKG